ncbi:MAG: S41 family peptidase [Chitinophagaceae bacterium]
MSIITINGSFHRTISGLITISCFFVTSQGRSMAQTPGSIKLTDNIKKQVTDSLVQAIENYYVYPETGRQITAVIRQKMKTGSYDSIRTTDDFTKNLISDLSVISRDKHLLVRYDPDLQKRILAYVATSIPDKKDTNRDREQNYYFRKLEILPSNIGYLEFTNFADTSAAARATVRAAMQFLSNSSALILDLRNNFGGNATMASEIAGFFVNKKTITGRSFNRISNKWTENFIKNDWGIYLAMPIYILTSRRTFSAAEGLAYTLQQMKRGIVVGDSTRGGAHLTRSFSIGNGFVAFVPFTRSENKYSGTDWEGTGVIPDVPDASTSLYTAQRLILEKKLVNISDSIEIRKINWLINSLLSKTSLVDPDKIDSSALTGKFEEFVFESRGGRLICFTANQPANVNWLVAITPTLFQVDSGMQVKFTRTKDGQFDAIELYWSDGWVDYIRRTSSSSALPGSRQP